MREILFRGKRIDNGEWVQGFYVKADHHWHKNGIHKDWIALGASANGGWFALHNKYAVKSETVGQFTGLTDKNGKKIFEGDIICYTQPDESYAYGIIKFRETNEVGFCVNWFNRHDSGWLRQDIGFWAKYRDIEVIGNIHDNPEFLEVPHE